MRDGDTTTVCTDIWTSRVLLPTDCYNIKMRETHLILGADLRVIGKSFDLNRFIHSLQAQNSPCVLNAKLCPMSEECLMGG